MSSLRYFFIENCSILYSYQIPIPGGVEVITRFTIRIHGVKVYPRLKNIPKVMDLASFLKTTSIHCTYLYYE